MPDTQDFGFDAYQTAAATTAIYPQGAKGLYPLLGLIGEVGEVVGKFLAAQSGDDDSEVECGYLYEDVYGVMTKAILVGDDAERAKKIIRGTKPEAVTALLRNCPALVTTDAAALLAVQKEIGDVLWYLAAYAGDHGLSLAECATKNLEKLRLRQKTDTLHGSGDDRELSPVHGTGNLFDQQALAHIREFDRLREGDDRELESGSFDRHDAE